MPFAGLDADLIEKLNNIADEIRLERKNRRRDSLRILRFATFSSLIVQTLLIFFHIYKGTYISMLAPVTFIIIHTIVYRVSKRKIDKAEAELLMEELAKKY